MCFGAYAALNPRINASASIKWANYLELATQCIELTAYGFIWRKAAYPGPSTEREIVRARYYDWFVTTAIMMWTTWAIIDELNTKDDHKVGISPLAFVLNVNLPVTLMLLFGYLTETDIFHETWRYKRTAKWAALVLGFCCLSAAFTHLKDLSNNDRSRLYVDATMALWMLYGVCFIAGNDAQKNFGYTLLDVFSKNINGIYIAYLLIRDRT